MVEIEIQMLYKSGTWRVTAGAAQSRGTEIGLVQTRVPYEESGPWHATYIADDPSRFTVHEDRTSAVRALLRRHAAETLALSRDLAEAAETWTP